MAGPWERYSGYMSPDDVAAGGKPRVPQQDGTISTEKTISIEADGRHFVIPTIVDGVSYTQDAAADMFMARKIAPIASFKTAQEAKNFAEQRSRDLDKATGGTGVLRKGNSAPASGELTAGPAGPWAKYGKASPVDRIPGLMPEANTPVPPSMTDSAIGAAETALTAATGATGGTVGFLGGALSKLASEILNGNFGTPEAVRAVEEAAMKGSRALTYQPRTQTGQDMTAALGEVAALAPPVLPAMPAMGGAATMAAPAVARAAETAATAGKRAVATVADRAKGGAVTPGSAGAAAVDTSLLRQARANELPVPVKLTEGQKTRDFADQRFERETAKDSEIGGPIRERFTEQNRQLQQNLDTFIDATGAEAPDLRSIGLSVDKAIRDRAAKDKSRIRTLYKEAEKAGEMEGPADLKWLASYLNDNRAGRTSAPIMQTIADELVVQGLGGGNLSDGTFKVVPGSLKQAENVRKAINKFAKSNDPNDLRVASEMKGIIDQSTEGAGGKAYRTARAARARYAKDYEDIGLVRNIIGNKRGSQDRAIALEDVLNRSVISPSSSLDEVRNIRRLLQTEGENGRQAWKELQGGTLKYIRDEATKNVARNEAGDPIVSAAQLDRTITALDKSGKLDFIFGKKGGETLRTINDVAKDVLTVPHGAVNMSNTVTALMAAIDLGMMGVSGVPAPIVSGFRMAAKGVKNAKTKARVKRVLGD